MTKCLCYYKWLVLIVISELDKDWVEISTSTVDYNERVKLYLGISLGKKPWEIFVLAKEEKKESGISLER